MCRRDCEYSAILRRKALRKIKDALSFICFLRIQFEEDLLRNETKFLVVHFKKRSEDL